MKKLESAVSETNLPPPVIDYKRSYEGLLNDRQDWENRHIKEQFSNNALRDKMEAARRNIAELKNICFILVEKGLYKSNSVDESDKFDLAELYKKSLVLLKQNVEALSEINKFKC